MFTNLKHKVHFYSLFLLNIGLHSKYYVLFCYDRLTKIANSFTTNYTIWPLSVYESAFITKKLRAQSCSFCNHLLIFSFLWFSSIQWNCTFYTNLIKSFSWWFAFILIILFIPTHPFWIHVSLQTNTVTFAVQVDYTSTTHSHLRSVYYTTYSARTWSSFILIILQ